MATIIDITDIADFLRAGIPNSGIQRVVVQIAVHAIRDQGPEDRILLGRFGEGCRTYHVTEARPLLEHAKTDLPTFGTDLDLMAKEQVHPPGLRKYVDAPAKMRFHIRRRTKAAERGDAAFFERRGQRIEDWREWMDGPSEEKVVWAAYDEHPFTAGGGNHFLLAGSLWNTPAADAWLKAQKTASGASVTYLVHDLIPLLRPDLCAEDTAKYFNRWIHRAADAADRMIAISTATATDLAAFLEAGGYDVPVEIVRLAQAGLSEPGALDFDSIHDEVRYYTRLGDATRLATSLPYALFVGTIEPRKNVWRAIQAWKQLILAGRSDLPRLVLAGSKGWLYQDVERVLDNGGLDGYVTLVHRPSDADLDHLYRNCAFTILPSHYEGWGLPIGEGLSYGKTGVVSRASSMPEVGGDLVTYCDPLSIASIRDAVDSLVDPEGLRADLEAKIAKTTLRSWSDATAGILAATAGGTT